MWKIKYAYNNTTERQQQQQKKQKVDNEPNTKKRRRKTEKRQHSSTQRPNKTNDEIYTRQIHQSDSTWSKREKLKLKCKINFVLLFYSSFFFLFLLLLCWFVCFFPTYLFGFGSLFAIFGQLAGQFCVCIKSFFVCAIYFVRFVLKVKEKEKKTTNWFVCWTIKYCDCESRAINKQSAIFVLLVLFLLKNTKSGLSPLSGKQFPIEKPFPKWFNPFKLQPFYGASAFFCMCTAIIWWSKHYNYYRK